MIFDNQVVIDEQNKDAPIDGTVGGGACGNWSSESISQFGSGQPLMNPAMHNVVSIELMPTKLSGNEFKI